MLSIQLEMKLREAESQLRALHSHGPLRTLAEGMEVGKLPLSRLEQLHKVIRHDLERLELVRPPFPSPSSPLPYLIPSLPHPFPQGISQRQGVLCTQCKEFPRCVLTHPCQHCVLCEQCGERLGMEARCPYCNEKISQRTTVLLPP